jgi:hypothetical protein
MGLVSLDPDRGTLGAMGSLSMVAKTCESRLRKKEWTQKRVSPAYNMRHTMQSEGAGGEVSLAYPEVDITIVYVVLGVLFGLGEWTRFSVTRHFLR